MKSRKEMGGESLKTSAWNYAAGAMFPEDSPTQTYPKP